MKRQKQPSNLRQGRCWDVPCAAETPFPLCSVPREFLPVGRGGCVRLSSRHSSPQLHAGTAPGATIPAAACAEFLKCFRIGYWVFKAGKGEEEQVDADCSACTGGSDCGEPPRSSSLPHPAGPFLFHLAPAKKTQGWTKRNVAESIMSPLIQQAK